MGRFSKFCRFSLDFNNNSNNNKIIFPTLSEQEFANQTPKHLQQCEAWLNKARRMADVPRHEILPEPDSEN